MAAEVEAKTMVPTILVGIGGTGAEVLSRVRRLAEESYGSLRNFPVLSFLVVDTDKDYKISNPEASGSPFKDTEKHFATVSGRQVEDMVCNMGNYPWIESWFPKELERNIGGLEAGAGQIRACGRFAFFCNYDAIRKKFLDAVKRVKGKENSMLDRYGVKVKTNQINIFVTGSLSGGTGSGMLIDMAYCIRHWIQGEGSPLVTGIMPMPTAFSGISAGDRVLANGYAALMELSYFCDHRTEYAFQFSEGQSNEVRSQKPPFDFTYLVGTKNGESDFSLEQIREMMAQNIFLDLTSEFAPHKRSIRDNIKGAFAQADPGGRGYPKNFMSFGLSTIEIPVAQIRASLSNRLAKDLAAWWLNESAILPPQMLEVVRGDILKPKRLSQAELLADLSAGGDRSYIAIISEWVNSLRNEIANDNWLECKQQGVKVMGSETGNIMRFLDEYLNPKVEEYRREHFRELSTDERQHGDYLKRMYSNRNEIIQRGRQALEEELYSIIEDRQRGPKFAAEFITTARQIFDDTSEKFRREKEKIWEPNESACQKQYEQSIQDIVEFRDKFGLSKQAKMEEYCESALGNLEGILIAIIQRQARALGVEVIDRLKEHLTVLERQLNQCQQRLIQARDHFDDQSRKEAESADALLINGLKLYDRQELNDLYQNVIEQLAGETQGSQTTFEIGMDKICTTMSEEILQQASPLWKDNRAADEVMRLFDIISIPEVKESDWREIVSERTYKVIQNSPESSKLKTELAACDRLFKAYNDEEEVVNQLRVAYNKSKPLIVLSESVLKGKDANFNPSYNTNVALRGGRNTGDPAAQKVLPLLGELEGIKEDDIKPLGDNERHRLVFVQEMGGFSLRCIDGMKELRRSYQDWKGETIIAKRAQLRGESRDLPIPVHMQKEAPFWDIFPEDPNIFKLIVLARALAVLQEEENRATQERNIRYTRQTEVGTENVDLASSWEEAIQVLEVPACRPDREEIDSQVQAKREAAETPAQKHALFQQFMDYLKQLAGELDKQGGEDSKEYKRERDIIRTTIQDWKLPTQSPEASTPAAEPASSQPSPTAATPVPEPDLEMVSTSNGSATPAPPPADSNAQGSSKGNMEELQKLAEMKKEGLLSEEEFQAAKRKLLGMDG